MRVYGMGCGFAAWDAGFRHELLGTSGGFHRGIILGEGISHRVLQASATTVPEHEFTLVLLGDLDDDAVDALFETGCDDARVGEVDGVGFADFIREAPSFGEALRSAIGQVESVPGLKGTRVEPADFMTSSEIAERFGQSRE